MCVKTSVATAWPVPTRRVITTRIPELSGLTDAGLPLPRFSDARLEQLEAEAAAVERDPLMALVARIKLLATAGQISSAQAMLRQAEIDYPVATIRHDWFRELLTAAIFAHGTALAAAWLSLRFRSSYGLEIDFESSSAPPRAVNLRIRKNDARFVFTHSLLALPAAEMILTRWVDAYILFDAFMDSPLRIDGSVNINLSDGGARPGLAFSEYRPGYYLIPDASYLAEERYSRWRTHFRENNIPWDDRASVGFWRGATSGIGRRLVAIGQHPDPATRWRGAPRIHLCEIARLNPDIIDAGITAVVQIADPDAQNWLQSHDLLRQFVPSESFQKYRYQIDIDGNTNSWSGFFIKLLTGSPVLKVASRLGFQQWYYDRLIPWVNYVPVASDMSDLVEKVLWLRANDDAARNIGAAGRELAESLTERQEIIRAAPAFAAAIRAARGDPLIDLEFGSNAIDNAVLRNGWHDPDEDGVRAGGYEARIELSKPLGLCDYILSVEVSPAISLPQRVTIIANGSVLSQVVIVERTTVSCPLSRSVATASETIELRIFSPDAKRNASQASPLDVRMFSILLHRLSVAACPPDSGPTVMGGAPP